MLRNYFPSWSAVWAPDFTVEVSACGVGRYFRDERRIEVPDWAQTDFDRAFIFAHEAGHAFDDQLLDDDARGSFAAAVGSTLSDWGTADYYVDPAEAFAMAFARVCAGSPWRCNCPTTRYWADVDEPAVLSTARAVLSAARCRRSLAART